MDGPKTDRNRGVEYGRREWRPGLLLSLRSGSWSGTDLDEAFAVILGIGLDAGAQDAVTDRAAFLEGVLAGFGLAEADFGLVAASHRQAAGCDPESRWGLCEYCAAYAAAMAWSQHDKARWAAELAEADREFVLLTMVHTRECSVVAREVAAAEELMIRLTPAMARHGGERVEWPKVVDRTHAVAARRKRCSRCAPDLPDQPVRGSVKGSGGRFTAAAASDYLSV